MLVGMSEALCLLRDLDLKRSVCLTFTSLYHNYLSISVLIAVVLLETGRLEACLYLMALVNQSVRFFFVFSLQKALPELSEDVLRLHADVSQWTSVAQHHSAHHGQSAARRA